MMNKTTTANWLLVCFALMLFFSMLVSLFPPKVAGLSARQKDLIESGVRYFNIDEETTCSLAGVGGPTGTQVPLVFNLGTEGKQRRITLISALMADYGLTAEQAAGPVGNFMVESGGEHLPPDINQGDTVGAPPKLGPLGYGWAQWSGGRQDAFITYAVDNGYMGSSAEHATDAANYAYLKYELANGYEITISELKQQTTPEDAAVSFEATFEKAGKPVLDKRKAAARKAYTEFTEGGGGTSTSTGSCGSAGNAAISGDRAFPLITTKNSILNRDIFQNSTTNTAGHPYTAYDILVDPGTPVAAMVSGTVTRISSDKCPGRLISIYNADDDITVSYLHLSFNDHVLEGDEVEVGQQIGLVGSAGEGCGTPHLHIDAVSGDTRPSCSRENCPTANASKFLDIGPDLYETFQLLAE